MVYKFQRFSGFVASVRGTNISGFRTNLRAIKIHPTTLHDRTVIFWKGMFLLSGECISILTPHQFCLFLVGRCIEVIDTLWKDCYLNFNTTLSAREGIRDIFTNACYKNWYTKHAGRTLSKHFRFLCGLTFRGGIHK